MVDGRINDEQNRREVTQCKYLLNWQKREEKRENVTNVENKMKERMAASGKIQKMLQRQHKGLALFQTWKRPSPPLLLHVSSSISCLLAEGPPGQLCSIYLRISGEMLLSWVISFGLNFFLFFAISCLLICREVLV